MKKTVMLVLVSKRREEALEVQKRLTEYGCYIKTRLGMHEASDDFCAETGLIMLELVGDQAKHQELYNAIKSIPCTSVKLDTLEIENCN